MSQKHMQYDIASWRDGKEHICDSNHFRLAECDATKIYLMPYLS
jgi:hypothetical protein